jgi:hypothetical protein
VRVASIPTALALALLQVTDHRRVVGRSTEEVKVERGGMVLGVEFVDDRVLIREGWGCQEQDGRLEYRSCKSED